MFIHVYSNYLHKHFGICMTFYWDAVVQQPPLFSSLYTGNLTEVNLPIDKLSKRIKGFAHVTFMFPEHAVQAFNKLDGTNYKVCSVVMY